MTTQLAATGLAARLRTETRAAHESAENSAFMTRLAHGEATREDLLVLTRQLLHVYEALEEAARGLADDESFAAFHDPALERVESLRADLAALANGAEVPLTPEGEAYADRIRRISGSAPSLVAHHYTRYLGDLSGGQALGAIFGRSLGIAPGDPGISFYHFADIEKVKPYKDRYRDALDAAPFTEEQLDEAVAEAVVAFELNQAIFAALDAR